MERLVGIQASFNDPPMVRGEFVRPKVEFPKVLFSTFFGPRSLLSLEAVSARAAPTGVEKKPPWGTNVTKRRCPVQTFS